jgi:hypothetical protein
MVLVAAVTAVACTGSGGPNAGSEPVTIGRLAQATVAARDLPDGFRQVLAAPGIEGEVVVDHRCDDAIEELEPAEQVTSAASDGAQTLVSVVAWFPGESARAENAYRRAASSCRSASTPGGSMIVRASPLDLGPISDDVLATLFEVEERGMIHETAVVLIRRGDLVAVLRLDGPRPVSRRVLDQVTRLGINRLSEAARRTDT